MYNMKTWLPLFLIAFVATPAFAKKEERPVFAIDQAHSTVQFNVRHLLTKTKGVFNTFDGKVSFDPESKEGEVLMFEIDASSIDTRNEKRDKHLRSEDFFNVEKFPKITFVSDKKVKFGKDNKARVPGKLTLHGVTKPIVLDVEYGGSIKSPWGKERLATFAINAQLDRTDYGMSWNDLVEGVNLVGEEVGIEINLEMKEVLEQKEEMKKDDKKMEKKK